MIKRISVVIPAYNEEEGITKVLEGLAGLFERLSVDFELIVVDDGSKDKTRTRVESFKQKKRNVVLLSHEKNRGYGAALKTGIRKASSENILVIDADCTYPIEEIPKLLEKLSEADMVVGARIGEKVKVEKVKKPVKWFLQKLASFLSESDIKDLNSGLRIFKKNIALRYFHILPDKFSFTTTITLAMLGDGYIIKYVPINYYPREGKSKIKPTDTLSFLSLILRTVLYFNPLKVLLPVSLFLLLAGATKLGADLVLFRDVRDSSVFLILTALQVLILGLLADLIVKRAK